MGLVHSAVSVWLAQRGHLLPWAPIAVALGVGIYFALKVEPGRVSYLWIGGAGLACALIGRRAGVVLAPVLWALALAAAGLCVAAARAHLVDGPVL